MKLANVVPAGMSKSTPPNVKVLLRKHIAEPPGQFDRSWTAWAELLPGETIWASPKSEYPDAKDVLTRAAGASRPTTIPAGENRMVLSFVIRECSGSRLRTRVGVRAASRP